MHYKTTSFRLALSHVLLPAMFIMTSGCNSSAQPLANPTLYETLNTQELDAYIQQRPSLRQGILASIEKSKNISDRPVKIRVGEYLYRVPLNYLNPWGEWNGQKPKFSEHDKLEYATSGFHAFLPDFRGYDRKNFLLNELHPDHIKVNWWSEEHGGIEAEALLNNRIKGGMNESIPSLFQYDLHGYKGLGVDADKIAWIGISGHGQRLLIKCQGPIGASTVGYCKVDYHHARNNYWLHYFFQDIHLARWREIDDNINRLIMQWRVGAVSGVGSTK